MIRKGEPWETDEPSPADREVAGGDADLATAIAGAPGILVRFRPDDTSDLARAIGLRPEGGADPAGTALPCDAMLLADGSPVCNMVVLGAPPDRLGWSAPAPDFQVAADGDGWFSGPATTVVIANGQFLRGADLVPRGHPGDGRLEIQVYALDRRERRAMRSRLATGSHLPHPRIHTRTARRVTVRSARPVHLEVDGVARGVVSDLLVEVLPGAYRLLI